MSGSTIRNIPTQVGTALQNRNFHKEKSMYRWILSLLALLGYTGMAAQAQQAPQSDRSNSAHLGAPNFQQTNTISDGTTAP